MLVQEHQELQNASLHAFEQKVLEANYTFCCLAWQYSSKRIKSIYPRYGMTRSELNDRVIEFQEQVARKDAISVEHLLINILDPLVSIRDGFDHTWSSMRASGRTLRLASYAGCALGGAACFGDLEYELNLLQKSYLWEEGAIQPMQRLRLYKSGEGVLLHKFLCRILETSLAELLEIVCEDSRMITNHAPSVWCLTENAVPTLDLNVLRTEYHLYTSLLRLIEFEPGSA